MSAKREQVLTCACDLYLAEGLDGFSMRKLAKILGVTAPALYRHYASKEHVLLDVVGEAYRTLIQYLHRALQGRSPEERFRLAGRGYVEFALDHRRYYEVLFMGVELLSLPDVKNESAEQGCAMSQFWNDRVREMIAAGKLAEGDTEGIGMTLWAHAHGLISLHLKGMLPLDKDTFLALYERSSARVMQGLGSKEYATTLGRDADLKASIRIVGSNTEVG